MFPGIIQGPKNPVPDGIGDIEIEMRHQFWIVMMQVKVSQGL
jgi:hypothetical protein